MKINMNVKVILPTNKQGESYIDEDKMYLKDISNTSELDGDAVFQSSAYGDVFGNRRNRSTKSKKRLSVVKITANRKPIYRAFRAIPIKDNNKSIVGLSPNSLRMINDKNGVNPTEVMVEKGSPFFYYWSHPDKAIRISFKLGLISLLLGAISIIISIVSWII